MPPGAQKWKPHHGNHPGASLLCLSIVCVVQPQLLLLEVGAKSGSPQIGGGGSQAGALFWLGPIQAIGRPTGSSKGSPGGA
jgi:hypothetical protein